MRLFKIRNSKWSETKKKMLWFLVITLALSTITLAFLNVRPLIHKAQYLPLRVKTHADIMAIRPKQDPDIAWLITDILIEACQAYNVPISIGIGIIDVETKCNVKAINEKSQAMGLMQWLASEKRLKDYNMEAWEVIHIRFNIWDCTRILREDGMNKGKGIKAALYHYNGVKAKIKDGDKYVSDVLSKAYDIEHREGNHEQNPQGQREGKKKGIPQGQ